MARLAPVFLLILILINHAWAGNLLVAADGGGEYPTIQSALDAAAPGDSIELNGGNYTGPGNVDLVVNTTDLTLWNSVHPTRIIGGTARGLTVNAEGFRMEGIGVENCEATSGGGILVNAGGAIFVNVRIMFCDATYGGGLYMASSGSLILDGCFFQYNFATQGGGIYLEDDSGPTEITNCDISNNIVLGSGGGIHATAVSPQIADCMFLENSAHSGGGADIAFSYDCTAIVERCEFREGQALDGSAVFLGDNDLSSFEFCVFHHSGGAVDYNRGGAVFATNDAFPVFGNCTFSFCHAYQGGVIFCDSAAAPTMDNCILAYNTGGGAFEHFDAPGIQFSCSDLFANVGGDWTGDIAAQAGVDGNFSQDPQLIHPWFGDFDIASNSPCSPDLNPGCGLVGAGEVVGVGPSYVLQPGGSGMLSNIQAAIDLAPTDAQVLLDVGTYTGPGNRDLDFGGKMLHLGALHVYSTRPVLEVGGSESDPHRGVWLHSGEPVGTTIHHLKIRGAYTAVTSDMPNPGYGGAVLVTDGAKVLLDDVVFEGNLAEEDGSAIHATGTGSFLEVVDSEFLDHDLILYSQTVSAFESSLSMTNCQIDGSNYYGVGFVGNMGTLTLNGCHLAPLNNQEWAAIGVTAGAGTVMIENCSIVDPQGGTTLWIEDSSDVTFSGCTITTYPAYGVPRESMGVISSTVEISGCDFINGNLGSDDHRAITSNSSVLTLSDCDFSGYDPMSLAGIVRADNGSLYADGCTFTNTGGGFYVPDGTDTEVLVTSCVFSGVQSWCVDFASATGSVTVRGSQFTDCYQGLRFTDSADCLIEDCDFDDNLAGRTVVFDGSTGSVRRSNFVGNSAASEGGALYLLGATVAVDSCAFTANSSNADGGAFGAISSIATVTNSSFLNNSSDGFGGALLSASSSITMADCLFDGNQSQVNGGALAAISSPLDIDRCVFIGNSGNWGGAINTHFESCLLDDCRFESNISNSSGAIHGISATLRIIGCQILGNQSSSHGAVYFNQTSNSQMVNTLVAGNQSGGSGGGIFAFNAHPQFFNNTFVGNGSYSSSAQLHFAGVCSPEIVSNIIAYSSSGAAVACMDPPDFTPIVTCNDVIGNADGDWVGPMDGLEGVEGNFSAEPLFCDMEGGDYYLTAYHSPCLPANSPCGDLVGAFNWGCHYDPVDVPSELPSAVVLLPNHPNPFNPRTEIRFELPEAIEVTLVIYDVAGRAVSHLIDGEYYEAGRHAVAWRGLDDEGREVPSGIYFTHFEAEGESRAGKLTLLR